MSDQNYVSCVTSIKAIVVLYNFLMRDQRILSGNLTDEECGQMPVNVGRNFNGAGTFNARILRDRVADYFLNEGQVSFQWEKHFWQIRLKAILF